MVDGSKFDEIARSLGRGLSRRSVVKGLAGVFAGGMVARQAAEAAPAPKVTICHFTHSETNPYNIITVSANSVQLQSHLSHGDHVYGGPDGGCCLDSDCSVPEGTICATAYCDVATGTCQLAPTPGESCDDGLWCTVDDVCGDEVNQCSGTERNCSDGIACTVDTCDEEQDACVHTPIDSLCASDNNVCTDEFCRPSDPNADSYGCVSVDNNATCDDSDACTVNDICSSGTCSGTPLDCSNPPVCKVWTETCSEGACVYADRVCDDGFHCEDDECVADDSECLPKGNAANGPYCASNDDCCSGCCQKENYFCLPASAAGSDACLGS